MRRLRLLLPLALLAAWASLPARSQTYPIQIACQGFNTPDPIPCSLTGPSGTGTGAPAWYAFGAVNQNFSNLIAGVPLYSVTLAGAKCDGSTNDTSVVQSLINSKAGIGIIWFPPNVTACMVSQLTLPASSHLIIDGEIQQLASSAARQSLITTTAANVTIEIGPAGIIDGNKSNETGTGTEACVNATSVASFSVQGRGGYGTIQNCVNWPLNIGGAGTTQATVSYLNLLSSGNAPEFYNGTSHGTADHLYISGIADVGWSFYGGCTDCAITNSTLVGNTGGISVLSDSGQGGSNTGIDIIGNNVSTSTGNGIGISSTLGSPIPNEFAITIHANVLHDNNQGNIGNDGGINVRNATGVNSSGNIIYHDGNGTASSVGVYWGTGVTNSSSVNDTVYNEGQGGDTGVCEAFNGSSPQPTGITVSLLNCFDNQATKTTAFGLNGTLLSPSNILIGPNNIGSLIGAGNNLTYATDTAVTPTLTNGGTLLTLPSLLLSGSLSSAAALTNGIGILGTGAPTYTDSSSTGGTISAAYMNAFPAVTFTATVPTTYTTAAAYFFPAMECSTNTTCTTKYAVLTNGILGSTGGMTIAGATSINITGSGNTTIGGATNSGTVTVGNSSNTGKTVLAGLASSSAAQTGTVCIGSGNVLSYDTTTTCLLSSIRWKHAVASLFAGLWDVMRMRAVSYDLKPEFNPAHLGRQVGLIAEDVQKVDPRLVGVDRDGKPMGVRYLQMTAVLVNAVQELALIMVLGFAGIGVILYRTRRAHA